MSLCRATLLAGLAGAMLLGGCRAQPGASSSADAAATAADNLVPAPGSAPLSHAGAGDATPAPGETGSPASDGPPPATAAASTPATATPSPAPSGPTALAPDLVLRRWGSAVERRDWAAVRGLWGHRGADSGLTARQFAARWDGLRRPLVVVGAGSQEGAAGSLYYTAPVTITDGARRISGSLTIRRVNDVPGATPEQLRWHADATTRAPWTTLR